MKDGQCGGRWSDCKQKKVEETVTAPVSGAAAAAAIVASPPLPSPSSSPSRKEKINVENNWKKFHYFESNGISLEMIGKRFDKVICEWEIPSGCLKFMSQYNRENGKRTAVFGIHFSICLWLEYSIEWGVHCVYVRVLGGHKSLSLSLTIIRPLIRVTRKKEINV